MPPIKIEVGKVYPNWKLGVPERVQFDFSEIGGLLLLAYNNPSLDEIRQVKKGKVQLGLSTVDGIFFFLSKFGNLPWSDSPYHYALSKPYEIKDLPEDGSKGYAIQVVLVDNVTGIVKVLRLIAMPYDMSLHFQTVVALQKLSVEDGEFNIEKYDVTLARIYQAFSTDTLVKKGTTYTL